MKHRTVMTLFVAWLLGLILGFTVETDAPQGVTVINRVR
jgi:hypothetical protein